MTNPAGTRFAQRLADYLTVALGTPVERRVQHGTKDMGDLSGLPPDWVCEVKATRTIALGQTMNEAQKEAANADARHFAAVFNRRSHDLRRSYGVVELHELARLWRLELWARTAGAPEDLL